MWTVASTTALLTTTFTDVGTVIAFVIPAIIVVAVALLGLGYGYRLLKRHVTGRKF